ncbi:MAG: discoidin domain-containing protein, partial [Bacteroidetes bacterium]|nr:discoidin domain-containing protein [Bacteroidota bacterium]
GTEFSGYADGVVVGSKPLFDGIEIHPQSDPLSMKLGGFARGAGHGSTYQDNYGNYWHVSTIMLSVKNNFERRIGIWPAGFDKDDVMWCNTAFGDYPHYLPASPNPSNGGATDSLTKKVFSSYSELLQTHSSVRTEAGAFTGWMLLNYKKPITVSSTLGGYHADNAVDEDIKTYWSAASAEKGEWIQSDLGNISIVNAIQINYADQDVDSNRLGKYNDQYHQYKLYYSADGKKWKLLVDKSNNKTDVPHEYIELPQPVQARFIKLENIHMPTGKFAISGFRIFGNGNGEKPDAVKTFIVLRTEKDKRSAWLKWNPVDNVYAYNIYYGTAPDKLYNCIMVMGNTINEYWFKAMDSQKEYYFAIESVNENGVSARKTTFQDEPVKKTND